MQLNFLGLILAALGRVGVQLPTFVPRSVWRGATAPREPRSISRHRGHLAKAARGYAVRYTNLISRRKAADWLLEKAAGAHNAGQRERGIALQAAAATFPW